MQKIWNNLFCAACLFGCSACTTQITETYTNPVFQHGADPFITCFNGKFYAAKTTDDGIELFCADRIGELEKSQPVRIFTGEKGTDHFMQCWAPEFHQINGKWYCYFTASPGEIGKHKMFVLRNTEVTLPGKWEFAGALTTEQDGWCIDGTIFVHKERYYMIYAHNGPHGEELVIRPMLTPEKLGTERAVISVPQNGDDGIHEGVFQLNTGKRNLLIITTNASSSDEYKLTTLELTGDDPMAPRNWKRAEKPFMVKSTTEFGPGHCTIFKDKNGDYFIAMQTIPVSGAGWAGRTIWVQKLIMQDDGTPATGQTPVKTGIPQTEPVIR